MKDKLGQRMKTDYENRTRFYLPRRTYTLMRIDGKAFHQYTKGLQRPFDLPFIEDMNETAIHLCKNIQGAQFAFVASDEISILLTDFGSIGTDAWFDGNIQKMCSVSASLATAKFNQLRLARKFKTVLNFEYDAASKFVSNFKLAEFDSRVWTIPSRVEVVNYFIWRQQDTVRNSISALAQSLYSHKELNGKNQDLMQEMCFQKGHNWNNLDAKLKRGRFIHNVKQQHERIDRNGNPESYWRSVWITDECPTFTADKEFLFDLIPINPV